MELEPKKWAMRLQRDFAILDSGKPSRSLEPCLHLHSNCLILSDLICIHLFVAFFIFQPLRTARALCLPLQVKRHFSQRTAAIVHLLCLFSLLLIYLRFCEEKSRLQLYRCLIVLHFSITFLIIASFPPLPLRSFLNNGRLNENWCLLGLNWMFALWCFQVSPLRADIFSVLCFPLRK